NDYGYDPVFARQVTGLGSEGDVLVAFTTSGNSTNILLALEAAKERGVLSIAMLGRDGGKAKGVADIEIIVPHGETARIQEVHGLLIHALCLGIERDLFPGLNEA
ncbi:MAG: SIS domain-containing protein, partial [Burkholderiaceae bacterium]|nr:SIS domain-containing protein [Burkholderiaceae bacterium]